jgi:hypothetical protein
MIRLSSSNEGTSNCHIDTSKYPYIMYTYIKLCGTFVNESRSVSSDTRQAEGDFQIKINLCYNGF